MKITGIEMTIGDLHEAVEQWLEKRGVKVKIKNIYPDGYPVRGYEVEVADEKAKEAEPCD